MEIAVLFGQKAMKKLAKTLDRTFYTNIPSIDEGIPFETLINRFRPDYSVDAEELHLLKGMLEPDPAARLTAIEAKELVELYLNSNCKQ